MLSQLMKILKPIGTLRGRTPSAVIAPGWLFYFRERAMEHLQYFGTPCILPEAKLAGDCAFCGDEMYEYQVKVCPICNKQVHQDCMVKCEHCGQVGCKSCMLEAINYIGVWFCDTSGSGEYGKSVCYGSWLNDKNN